MTPEELAYYRETLVARLGRLWRLRREYAEDLNLAGSRMLYRAWLATAADLGEALQRLQLVRIDLSSAPPPPAEPSPEGSP